MNRITRAIAKTQLKVNELTKEQYERNTRTADMTFAEFARFQTLKSAYMGSLLTEDEAIAIYGYLGNSETHFNKQPLAVKIVLTKVFGELLATNLDRRSCTS